MQLFEVYINPGLYIILAMRIREVYIASDHAGFKLKQAVMEWLDSQGVSYTDFGPFEGNQSVDYPDYAEKVGKAIRQQRDCYGILICGSGIGISIAANKINGIRAALCSEPVSAELSRLHNNANVLCMAGRMIGITMAQNIVSTFLKTSFEGGRHERRIQKIHVLEDKSQ